MRFFTIILTGLMASVLCASAGVTGYIKLGDIKGEATDSRHKGWSDIYSWGRVLDAQSGGGSNLQECTISKAMDSASPLIAEAVVNGVAIPQVRIHFVDTDNKRKLLHAVRLFNVRLTGVMFELPEDGVDPVETLRIQFTSAIFMNVDSDETGAPLHIAGTMVDLENKLCRLVGTGTADNDADAVDDALDDDDDNDGVSDSVEAEAKLNPLVFDSHRDEDQDGSSNGAEAKAGTNVFDPASRWQVMRVEPAPDGRTRIHWIAQPNRSYRILAATTLDGNWNSLGTITPDSPGKTFADVTRQKETGFEFYKLDAIPNF